MQEGVSEGQESTSGGSHKKFMDCPKILVPPIRNSKQQITTDPHPIGMSFM